MDGGSGDISISSLALPTAKTARQHLGDKKKSDIKQVHPGYSMFEWNKLCHSGRDMSGTKGKVLKVSPEELARHDSDGDVWTCVRGVVYNVTEFTKYHPGGKAQLMRGAGRDCTELFDKIHVWVNSESILKECIVGVLKGERRVRPPSSSSLVPGSTKPPFPQEHAANTEGTTVLSMAVPSISLKDAGLVDTSPDVELPSQSPQLVVNTPTTSLSSPSVTSVERQSDLISIPVPTISNSGSDSDSITELSLPVPAIGIVSLADISSPGPHPQLGSATAPDPPAVTIATPPLTDATVLTPTIQTEQVDGNSTGVDSFDIKLPPHKFETYIRGLYNSTHPLVSKTAYESEV